MALLTRISFVYRSWIGRLSSPLSLARKVSKSRLKKHRTTFLASLWLMMSAPETGNWPKMAANGSWENQWIRFVPSGLPLWLQMKLETLTIWIWNASWTERPSKTPTLSSWCSMLMKLLLGAPSFALCYQEILSWQGLLRELDASWSLPNFSRHVK